MIDIPENHAEDLEAEQKARHQDELDLIAQQFIEKLTTRNYATIECCEHMIGYHGSKEYHHLADTIEVAKLFKAKGYHCYYYDGYNNHGVNQRAVQVCKVAKTESQIHEFRNWCWVRI